MDSYITFSPKTYTLGNILNDIETGLIALPDLQRPFVWKMSKVRDLLDSLYKGLPVGSVILWEIASDYKYRTIGTEQKKREPRYLVIDGQQRLTSLFSIVKNKEIILENVKKGKIKIAFNPIKEIFEVSNPAKQRSVGWIDDISRLFENTLSLSFLEEYFKKNGITLDEEKDIIHQRFQKVRNILHYPLSVIELSPELDPEDVSEIFVRINSKGQSLTQSDFILTLMSVYWNEGREQLENFYKDAYVIPQNERSSSFNLINIKPSPASLVRGIVAYGFNRGVLKYAFLILKGKDLKNKNISEELRTKNFEIFKQAQKNYLDLTNWHNFIKIIYNAGFVNEKMISSKVAFYISYALYLLGKNKYNVEKNKLESLIQKWFVYLQLTNRYTGSPETVIEEDLNLLKEIDNLERFISNRIAVELTHDFWNTTLVEKLISSSPLNYAFQVYTAASIYDDVFVLFSKNTKLREYLSPLIKTKKKTLDLHHIFPKEYLKKLGFKTKEINQVANYIYIEYQDNIKIKDQPPEKYWLEMLHNVYLPEEYDDIYKNYDLPKDFYKMDYPEFLKIRRKLMAERIRKYFEKL